MVIDVFLAAVVGGLCVLSQIWTVRHLSPQVPGWSQVRVVVSYGLRMALIGFFLWHLVQQGLLRLAVGLLLFLLIYFGGVIGVALKRPGWLDRDGGRREAQWTR